jgi:hypothetical protein
MECESSYKELKVRLQHHQPSCEQADGERIAVPNDRRATGIRRWSERRRTRGAEGATAAPQPSCARSCSERVTVTADNITDIDNSTDTAGAEIATAAPQAELCASR